jgi:AcrR family transcriptional regulator
MNETSGTRNALLETARKLFARHGYEGTSIRAITSRAGANLGAVTYHFGTKERLYAAVLESVAVPLVGRIRKETAAASTPLAGVEAVVRGLFQHWIENPDWPSLMLHELALDRKLPKPVRRTMEGVFEIVSGLVRAGQRDGSILRGDPMLLTFSIVSQPIYFALVRRRLRDVFALDAEDPETRVQVVDHIAQFVRRGLAKPREAR